MIHQQENSNEGNLISEQEVASSIHLLGLEQFIPKDYQEP